MEVLYGTEGMWLVYSNSSLRVYRVYLILSDYALILKFHIFFVSGWVCCLKLICYYNMSLCVFFAWNTSAVIVFYEDPIASLVMKWMRTWGMGINSTKYHSKMSLANHVITRKHPRNALSKFIRNTPCCKKKKLPFVLKKEEIWWIEKLVFSLLILKKSFLSAEGFNVTASQSLTDDIKVTISKWRYQTDDVAGMAWCK